MTSPVLAWDILVEIRCSRHLINRGTPLYTRAIFLLQSTCTVISIRNIIRCSSFRPDVLERSCCGITSPRICDPLVGMVHRL